MFRFVEHTGEVELEIEAEAPAAVLEEAARAFGELVGRGDAGDVVTRRVTVTCRDLDLLLPGLLDELVLLAETEGFVPVDAHVELAEAGAEATIEGVLRQAVPIVKAATLHRLAFERRDEGWHARVVLDV